jgi:ferredoxin
MEGLTTESVKEKAKSLGADLVGVASIERFEGLSDNAHPRSILPEAKSVVVVGRAIPRGTLRGIEEGTNWGIYRDFGLTTLEEYFIPHIIYHLTRFFEDHGCEAIPIFPYPREFASEGAPVGEGKPAPDVIVDICYAATAAGLGEIALAGVFLTPRFGPLQRFNMLITDAPLEPSPILTEPICDRCLKCLEACPYEAMNLYRMKRMTVGKRVMEIAEIDWGKCRRCDFGAIRNRYDPERGRPDRIAAPCIRACLVHLEETERMGQKYRNPFRMKEGEG